MMIVVAKCFCIFMVTYWTVLGVLLYYTRDPFFKKKISNISCLGGVNESMKVIEKEPSNTEKEN